MPDRSLRTPGSVFRSLVNGVAAFAGLIPIPGPTSAPHATCAVRCLYVDALHGSDNNNGGTPRMAFATLGKASSVVAAGTTVYVMNGRYTDNDDAGATLTITTAGTPGAWITFAAYPGQHPVIALTRDDWQGIHLEGAAAYILIEGFEVAGLSAIVDPQKAQHDHLQHALYNEDGIYVDGYTESTIPNHIVIRNSYIHDCTGAGIAANVGDYLTVDNNIVARNAFWSGYAGSGITLYHLADIDAVTHYKNYVVNNVSVGNREYVPFQEISPPAITDGNAIIIDDNLHTQDNGTPYHGRTYVANNLVYANGGRGIHIYSSQHVDAANNTAYEDMLSPSITAGELDAIASNDVNIVNSIGVAAAGKQVNSTYGDTAVVYDYNVYAGTNQIPARGPHDIVGNPLFIDVHGLNFGLSAKSPARGSGTSSLAPATDLFGTPRTPGAIDRGAIQSTPAKVANHRRER